MANTGLSKTFSSSPTNNKKGTMSFWMKRSKLGSCQIGLTVAGAGGGNCGLQFANDDRLYMYLAYAGGTWYGEFLTNRSFKDIGAFYHIVIAWDTTLGTSSDRMKLYVNGVQETSLATANYPDQDRVTTFGDATAHYINYWSNSGYFDGVMSHFHYVDGTMYAASDFGSTDATTGEWKINTSPNVNYGTNGFFILKDGNSVTDSSSNSNDWTVATGTLTKTEDNPSNVFATFNSISGGNTMAEAATFSNGNNTVVCSGTTYNPFGSTIGVNKGKYYAEFKSNNEPGDGMIGVFAKLGSTGNYLGSQTHQYSWYRTAGNVGRIRNNSTDIVTSIGAWTTNDIIGIALDCDNNKLYFHKNGTYISNGSGTGDPSNGNYGISITDPDDTDLGFYFMTAMDWGGSGRGNWSANFGNGFFGTTAVATNSGNGYQDADGNGIMNYSVPTNYRCLCTKGLNQ